MIVQMVTPRYLALLLIAETLARKSNNRNKAQKKSRPEINFELIGKRNYPHV